MRFYNEALGESLLVFCVVGITVLTALATVLAAICFSSDKASRSGKALRIWLVLTAIPHSFAAWIMLTYGPERPVHFWAPLVFAWCLPLVLYCGSKFRHAKAMRRYREDRKAADAGETKAMYYLGYHYYNGRCVRQDTVEATRWWTKAADNGDAAAKAAVRRLGDK